MNQLPLIPTPEPEIAQACRTAPSTSHKADASVGGISLRQEAVLTVFRAFGGRMHLAALVSNYRRTGITGPLPKQSDSGIRTRASELVAKGRLVVTEDIYVEPTSGRRHRILALP